MAATFVFSPNSAEEAYYNAQRLSLLIMLVIWFTFIYSFAFICFNIFALNKRYQSLVVFTAAFFEVLMIPFSAEYWGVFKRLFSISESLYFNATHLYSLTLGMVAISLLLLGERTERRLFVFASFFVAVSFFFKPSLFVIMVPAFYLFVFLAILAEKKLNYNYLVGLVILFLVPIFFFVYKFNIALHTDVVGVTNFKVLPFLLFKQVSGFFLPNFLQANSFVQIIYVLFLGFAAFIPSLISSICRIKWRNIKITSSINYLISERESVFFLSLLILGLSSALLFVEDSYRLMHMNFSWSLGAGYIVALPFLLCKALCLTRGLRKFSLIMIYMHIGFGMLSLVSFFFFL